MLQSRWNYGGDGRGSARPFYRSRYDRWVFGVCGGIAEYFGCDPKLVRLLFVGSLMLTGPLSLVACLVFAMYTLARLV